MNIPADDDDEEHLLFNLVYCSRADATLGTDDLEQIVNSAQLHNARESITGWLVYSNGIFFQWLEGAREKITRLMSSIAADRRHNTLVVLSEAEEVRTRLFSDWDMELVSAQDIRGVLDDAIQATDDSNSIAALRLLLKELDSKAVGTH